MSFWLRLYEVAQDFYSTRGDIDGIDRQMRLNLVLMSIVLGVQQISPDTVGLLNSAIIGEILALAGHCNIGQPNFRLRLHAPQESVQDTMSSLGKD